MIFFQPAASLSPPGYIQNNRASAAKTGESHFPTPQKRLPVPPQGREHIRNPMVRLIDLRKAKHCAAAQRTGSTSRALETGFISLPCFLPISWPFYHSLSQKSTVGREKSPREEGKQFRFSQGLRAYLGTYSSVSKQGSYFPGSM